MWSREVKFGADWNNSGRVNLVMGNVVVALDMVQVHCLGDAWLLIQVH